MPKHRVDGEGSVYKRADGKWVAALRVSGRKIVRYAGSRTDAVTKLNTLKAEHHYGALVPPSQLTLASWIDQWLALVEPELRPSTFHTYRLALATIADVTGATRLDKVTPLLLTQTLALLKQQGRGQRRLNLAHTYLKTCLKSAVDLGLLASNPLERVKKPRWEPRERRYWTLDETRCFLATALATPGRWYPLFGLLAVSGLRISEALALNWGDVNGASGTVQVSKALVWSGDRFDVLPPKTKAGRRTVTLPTIGVDLLKRMPRGKPGEPVFRTATGNVPDPAQLRPYQKRLCTLAGVPFLHLHGLRHVAAMLALEASGDAYVVQRRLGHANVGITLGIYGYSSRNEAGVARQLDELLAVEGGDRAGV